jgi:hypothetical protein
MREVVEVKVIEAFTVRLVFDDGSARTIDLEQLLRGPMFAPLKADPALFAQVAVDPELGTIVWPNGADMNADVLHGDEMPAWATPAR